MLSLASRVRPVWPLLAFLVSAGLLAGAHAFETFGGLAPCPLCLDQRKWHWAAAGVALALFFVARFRPGLARPAAAITGIMLLGAAGMAAYHVAVEQHWVLAQCDARIDPNDIRPMQFGDRIEVPKCDQIAWSMFGISMAGYNALISAFAALAAFAVAALPERKA